MEKLTPYLEQRSEGVLRLLEGGKRRGLEEMKKGKGLGSQKDLFQVVASSQKSFLELHDRCRSALRMAKTDEARDIALDIQYLLFMFSREVYEVAFATQGSEGQVSFPPPEAYSRHYPGEGPDSASAQELFEQYFGDTIYSRDKSSMSLAAKIDAARELRISEFLHQHQS